MSQFLAQTSKEKIDKRKRLLEVLFGEIKNPKFEKYCLIWLIERFIENIYIVKDLYLALPERCHAIDWQISYMTYRTSGTGNRTQFSLIIVNKQKKVYYIVDYAKSISGTKYKLSYITRFRNKASSRYNSIILFLKDGKSINLSYIDDLSKFIDNRDKVKAVRISVKKPLLDCREICISEPLDLK